MILQGFNILDHNKDGTWTASHLKSAQKQWRLCPEERFGEQPVLFNALAFCSGFLLSNDPPWIGTASHCVQGQIEEYWVIFGFQMLDHSTPNLLFRADDVYSARGVVTSGTPTGDVGDYGVLLLDRPVVGHSAYVRVNDQVQVGDSLAIVGYPMGLPKKTDSGGRVLMSNETMIRGDLDSYEGNSGAPVFDHRGYLVGLLAGGSDDFDEVEPSLCRRSKTCPGSEGCEEFGEFIVPIRVLLSDPLLTTHLSHLHSHQPTDITNDPSQLASAILILLVLSGLCVTATIKKHKKSGKT